MNLLRLLKNSSSNHNETINKGINKFSLNNNGEYSTVVGETDTNTEIANATLTGANFLHIKYVGKIMLAEINEFITNSNAYTVILKFDNVYAMDKINGYPGST